MTVSSAMHRQVKYRAQGRCEYCRMHQSLQGATFHVEHVIPRSRGGSTELENLAWACPSCNLHKSDRIEVTSSDLTLSPTKKPSKISLFHPRRDNWADHFCWEGYSMIALTTVGRATIEIMGLNDPRRIRIREAESLFDLFPPG